MLPTTHCNTIELGNESRFSDWFAIYNTPDSRLYRRLAELGMTEAGRGKPSSKPVDELASATWEGNAANGTLLAPSRARPITRRAARHDVLSVAFDSKQYSVASSGRPHLADSGQDESADPPRQICSCSRRALHLCVALPACAIGRRDPGII